MTEYMHARLAQLCREIEACCNRLGCRPAEADAERWADENSVIWTTGEKPLPDILKDARLSCQLGSLDQTLGFDLIRLGERVCHLVDTRPVAVVDLWTAVCALQQEARDIAEAIEAEITPPAEPQSNGAPNVENPKGKPGRKSSLESDAKIYDEYHDGKKQRLWDTQADYLRQKHPDRWCKNQNGAKSWLSQLLKRYEQRLKQLK